MNSDFEYGITLLAFNVAIWGVVFWLGDYIICDELCRNWVSLENFGFLLHFALLVWQLGIFCMYLWMISLFLGEVSVMA